MSKHEYMPTQRFLRLLVTFRRFSENIPRPKSSNPFEYSGPKTWGFVSFVALFLRRDFQYVAGLQRFLPGITGDLESRRVQLF